MKFDVWQISPINENMQIFWSKKKILTFWSNEKLLAFWWHFCSFVTRFFLIVSPFPLPLLRHPTCTQQRYFFSFLLCSSIFVFVFFSSSIVFCHSCRLVVGLLVLFVILFLNIVQRFSGFFYKNSFFILEISALSLLQD